MLQKLQSYFNSDPYSDELVSQLSDFIDTLPERDREKVYDRVVQERKYRSPVLVNDIRAAAEYLGVPFSKAYQVEKFKLTCEACETVYTYAPAVTTEDELTGVFCRCPNCGLPGSDQLLAHRYERVCHTTVAWFPREIAHFRAQIREGGAFVGGRFKRDEVLEQRKLAFG
jgi:hypothetical protein